jgi:hypothetical protein
MSAPATQSVDSRATPTIQVGKKIKDRKERVFESASYKHYTRKAYTKRSKSFVSQHFVSPGHSLDDFGRSKIYIIDQNPSWKENLSIFKILLFLFKLMYTFYSMLYRYTAVSHTYGLFSLFVIK